MTRPPKQKAHGFVFPFVLVSIAVLSLVALSSFQAITNASTYITQLRGGSDRAWDLLSAENEIIYAYIAGAPTLGGVYVGASAWETIANPLGEVESSGLAELDIWAANGGVRRVTPKPGRPEILVRYRAGSGLAPLNTLPQADLASVFISAGVSSAIAKQLAAKILDYRDEDNVRRFLGGERADYRLANLAAPANSPLRNLEELSWVLSVQSSLNSDQWRALTNYITTGDDNSAINKQFVHPHLQNLVIDSHSGGIRNRDVVIETSASDLIPSDRGRFTIQVLDEDLGYFGRIIEIKRTAAAVDKPFKRYWINDRTDTAIDVSSTDSSGVPLIIPSGLSAAQ